MGSEAAKRPAATLNVLHAKAMEYYCETEAFLTNKKKPHNVWLKFAKKMRLVPKTMLNHVYCVTVWSDDTK